MKLKDQFSDMYGKGFYGRIKNRDEEDYVKKTHAVIKDIENFKSHGHGIYDEFDIPENQMREYPVPEKIFPLEGEPFYKDGITPEKVMHDRDVDGTKDYFEERFKPKSKEYIAKNEIEMKKAGMDKFDFEGNYVDYEHGYYNKIDQFNNEIQKHEKDLTTESDEDYFSDLEKNRVKAEEHDAKDLIDDYDEPDTTQIDYRRIDMKTNPMNNLDSDQINLERQIHRSSIQQMKGELKQALAERKDKALDKAMQILNRQSQKLAELNLGDSVSNLMDDDKMEQLSLNRVNNEDIEIELAKIRIAAKYEVDGLERKFQASNNVFDMVEDLNNKLDQIDQHEARLTQLGEYMSERVSNSLKPDAKILRKFQKFKESIENDKLEASEKQAREAYQDYQRNLLMKIDHQENYGNSMEYTRVEKSQIVKRIYGMIEQKIPDNVGTDLIVFGLRHGNLNSIRLGEDIAGRNEEIVPVDVQRALSEYKLDNAEKVRDHFQQYGALAGQVRNSRQELDEKWEGPTLPDNHDEIQQVHQIRYNKWRLPSILKKDYRQYGELEEVFGKDRIQRLFE